MVEAPSSSNDSTPSALPAEEEEQAIDESLIPWDFIESAADRGEVEGLRSTSDQLVDLFLGADGTDGKPQQDSFFLEDVGSTSIPCRASTTSPIEFPFSSDETAQLCAYYDPQQPQIGNDSAIGLGADDYVVENSSTQAPNSCESYADTLLRQALMADAVECGENNNENTRIGRDGEDASMIASRVFSDFANDVLPQSTPGNEKDMAGTTSRVATPSPPPHPASTTGNNFKIAPSQTLSQKSATVVPPPPPPTMPYVEQNCASNRGSSASRLPKRRGSMNATSSRKNVLVSRSKKGSTRKANPKKVVTTHQPPPPPPIRPDVALSSSIPPPPPPRPDAIPSSSAPLPAPGAAKAARQKRMEKLASRNIGIAAPSRRSRLQREQITAEVVQDAAKGLENGLNNEEVARVAHELLLDVQLQHAGVEASCSNVNTSGLKSLSLERETSSSADGSVTATPVHPSNVAPQSKKGAAVGDPTIQATPSSFPPQSVRSSQVAVAGAAVAKQANIPPVPVVFATTTTTEKKTQRTTTVTTKKKAATTTTKRQPAKSKTPPARKKRKTKGGTTETAVVVPVTKPANAKKSTSTTSKKKNDPTPVKSEDVSAKKNETKKKKEGPKTHINGVPLPVGNDAESRRQRRLIRNRMSAQLHRERKREAIENYQKQVQERDREIEDLRNELVEVKARNTSLEEMISILRSKLGEEVFMNMIGDSSTVASLRATSQALPPSSPPHLVNDSDHSTVSPPSPYADRTSTSGEDTDALSTVPSSPVSCSSPLYQQDKDIRAPPQLALPFSSNGGKRSREAADGSSESQLPPTMNISLGRGRKKKARASAASLVTLSSVAICGVLGCIALITSPTSVKLSIFTPSWLAPDGAERVREIDNLVHDDNEHRRLSVDDMETAVGDDYTAGGISSSVKFSKTLVPTTRPWVISPLELHPERWSIQRNRPWTVQNSYVLFDKTVVNPIVPEGTYQEAFRQQLCRALLTTDVLYPSTMGTMAILCSPMANRMQELPSPPHEVSAPSSLPSQVKSAPRRIVNVNKEESQSSSMKPTRLRGTSPTELASLDEEEPSEVIDELFSFDQTDNDSERNGVNSMESSLYSMTSLSSRPFLYPNGGQQVPTQQKIFDESRNGKDNVDPTHRPNQNGGRTGQNNTSFLFCPSAFASVSPDFLDLIGKGASVFDKSRNSEWNSREGSGRLDGVFNDIDLDLADFDDEGNESFDAFVEGSASNDDSPLIDEINFDVPIEEEDQTVKMQGVDLKYPQNDHGFNPNYEHTETKDVRPHIWVQDSRENERDEETKALVPAFGQKGATYDMQRSLFSDKRVAQTSFVGGANEQYPNMIILVPLSAVHGNGSSVFREGYEDIPAAEQPWIELDCSVTSARIVDGIEFVSDDAIREDSIKPNSK